MRIQTFDTTLRDGTQGESVSFSVDDKLVVATKLDELGIDYIEGGWPGSNPKDKEFFERARELTLQHARLTAFGSTRFAKNPVEEDRNVTALVEAGTPVVSIFGKTWDLHVSRALDITLDENLVLISDTMKYLKDHGRKSSTMLSTSSTDMRRTPTTHCERSKPHTRPEPTFFASATPTAVPTPAAPP